MAKKSAKSKGYRRQNAKKPYLSKKEIAALCVIVAVLAVAAFFLFRYDDGALKVQNGAVVTDGDNWLVANGSNVRGGARYYKLGEIGEIDGYTRARGAQVADANLPQYTFTPAAEGGSDVTVTVSCGHGSAEAMAKYTRSLLEEGGMTGLGEIQTADLSGREARWYSYATEPAGTAGEAAGAGETEAPAGEAAGAGETEAPAAEAAGAGETEAPAGEAGEAGEAETPAGGSRYSRTLAGYVDASHDCCVIVSIVSRGDTDDDCLPDDALLAILEKTVGAVSLDK